MQAARFPRRSDTRGVAAMPELLTVQIPFDAWLASRQTPPPAGLLTLGARAQAALADAEPAEDPEFVVLHLERLVALELAAWFKQVAAGALAATDALTRVHGVYCEAAYHRLA